mmetsp:Transcript_2654/g.4778  ORF Transcript_2654/g.4778 Transcript_2654/m.4778 type:complete len:211 (-) Transcript_2654:2814-3446(-)
MTKIPSRLEMDGLLESKLKRCFTVVVGVINEDEIGRGSTEGVCHVLEYGGVWLADSELTRHKRPWSKAGKAQFLLNQLPPWGIIREKVHRNTTGMNLREKGFHPVHEFELGVEERLERLNIDGPRESRRKVLIGANIHPQKLLSKFLLGELTQFELYPRRWMLGFQEVVEGREPKKLVHTMEEGISHNRIHHVKEKNRSVLGCSMALTHR